MAETGQPYGTKKYQKKTKEIEKIVNYASTFRSYHRHGTGRTQSWVTPAPRLW